MKTTNNIKITYPQTLYPSGQFPIVEAENVKGGLHSVEKYSDLVDIIEKNKLAEDGMLVYVRDAQNNNPGDTYYKYNATLGTWSVFKAGGGGISEAVNTLADLNELEDVEEGTLVYVKSEKTYRQYKNGTWQLLTAGIPILNNNMYQSMAEENCLPEDYITIPDVNDVAATPTTTSFTNVGNGTYIDILFSSIRALQAEVNKLKNSFNYGIYSYNNEETAMSRIVAENEAPIEEEPLWATDEEDLSSIEGAYLLLSNQHSLTPKENVSVGNHLLTVSGTATWNDDEDLGYKTILDPKLYLFMTTDSLNIQINLKNCNNSENQININLNECGFNKSTSNRYNILFILSRAHEFEDNYYGYNFAWISVADFATLESEAGYWSAGNKIKSGATYFGTTSELEDNRYYISSVSFTNCTIYKFNCYSKFQNFSNVVEPINPTTDDDYKYRVAHITVRSVTSTEMMNKIKDQLPKNELVFNESNNSLYIKGTYKMIKLGASSSEEDNDSGMEKAEIISWLAQNGIVTTENGSGNVELNKIGDITFVHQATGKKFKFEVNSNGELKGTELGTKTLEERMSDVEFTVSTNTSSLTNYRGFVGMLGHKEQNAENPSKAIAVNKDIGLYADRVKIGSVYIPEASQKIYNCSHAFVELENTSDKDFQLDGCYLHFATGVCAAESNGNDEVTEHSIALTGILPAGGTYLIRGKQYTDFDQADCFIKVASYDQEWYVDGELIDFRLSNNNTFLLTYGLPGKDLDPTSTFSFQTVMFGNGVEDPTNAPWTYHPNFIDTLSIIAPVTYKTSSTWTHNKMKCITRDLIPKTVTGVYRDRIFKNTFELDPAKQAFQSCNTYDSSRKRNQSVDDYQCLAIDNKYISFPKTNEIRDVDFYTPKASYEHKNVCTDKSKLDKVHPNMVTCSFGINIHTTRCFNWISCGYFDEYIWIRRKGQSDWEARFESYKPGASNDDAGTSGFVKKTFGTFHNLTTGDSNATIQSVIYDRLTGHFPADGTLYTSHKCIVDLKSSAATSGSPVVYEYIVGRADINNKPDQEHISEIQTFTIYPTTFVPRIFQTTDQQGFHWIEYQCWAGAAKEVNKTINEAIGCTFESDGYTVSSYNYSGNIIPILLNTGDMTQNGTRVNEWLDYYNGGKCLFDHLEQMNVVGNNDLCNSIDEVDESGNVTTISYERLGTGDDPGKSNAYYFHVFYCYEIDPDIVPIISNENATHYVPSLYYFESKGTNPYRFVMFNSEITATTCLEWYKQLDSSDPSTAINVYTGWPITTANNATYDNSFTTIYTMTYDMLNAGNGVNTIVICHEMPFTVVTNANLVHGKENIDRSLKEKATGALVGCHGNRLNYTDTKAIYWFSRLLEHFRIKLVLGGHKHTYACTNPVREFYYYTLNGSQTSSLESGPMTMTRTLENDNVIWNTTVGTTDVVSAGDTNATYNYSLEKASSNPITINTTKFPLMKSSSLGITKTSALYYPYYGVSNLTGGVVYFMCQATGFKLKSNKELPSPDQRFAYVIPKTTVGASSDTPNANQQRPMFAEIALNGGTYTIYLYRVENIMNGTKLFSQTNYSNSPASFKFLKGNEASVADGTPAIYGNWGYTAKTPLIVVN